MVKDQDIVGDALAKVLPKHDKPWYRVAHLLELNLILLVPLLSSATAGYDGSMMNGLQATSSWKAFFNHPSGTHLGVVNAAQSIGSVAVLPIAWPLSDWLGRRWTLLIGVIAIIVASIIQAASVNYGMFTFSRILAGAGSIIVTQPSPILISELCYPTHRGKYTSLFWTLYYFGSILASWSTYGTQKHIGDSNWAWRTPSLLQGAYPLVQLCFFWWVPESPRWLVAKGRHEEARRTLARFHTDGDEEHPLIEFEMTEISRAIETEKETVGTGWSTLFKTPGNRRRMFIVTFIGAFAQWNGVSVVSYYLTLVLDTVGIKDSDTQTLINGLLQIWNFWAAASAAFLVDRLGRRSLFKWSGIGMLLSFSSWTACSAVFDIKGDNSAGIAVVAFIFIFFFHYDICYTPLLYGYTTEILPYSIRAKGLILEMFAIYGSLIVLAFCNSIALDAIGWKYYLVFVSILVVGNVVSWLFFPETKGFTLEEVAEIFDGVNVRADAESVLAHETASTAEKAPNTEHIAKI
ncbi:uncharacterized protein A1O5_03766 [Cladophialophora psammophila CBS 110553]|uniref:Major facilitator superfamily (MFS) profile domain-containing protein n=1 Tax=Cladophialophora psammophila CBS 110553 TaxID=1182543 RepID=W9X5L8_9EURO|nr:uncharacterized protein A1O5_03766 [Cladophialophora psammophila CBS 110553]EXJ72620.1 hypothetical protein A1O5_03766 [Cladophialophora psammophila CBS 110553]